MADIEVAALKQVPLFSRLSDKDLKRLAKMFQDRVFAPGDDVAVEGQEGHGFFLIESGGATVMRGGDAINTLGPGDWFGELALISKGPRTATVTASSELRCRALASWEFRPFLQEHADVTWAMLETLVERLRAAEKR